MDVPKNKAIDIREIARMYKEQYNEELPDIVDNYGYIHEMPAAPKPIPKEKSLSELVDEAKKYSPQLNKKESEPEPQPKVNEIKRLQDLIANY
jgi:hypothetical protein